MNRQIKKSIDKMDVAELFDAYNEGGKVFKSIERNINKLKKDQDEAKEIIDYTVKRLQKLSKRKIKK